MKDKLTAGLLAIFLGGFGAHKFYIGKPGKGIFYFLFCWTFIPSIFALVEGIMYISCPSDKAFNEKYVPLKVRQEIEKQLKAEKTEIEEEKKPDFSKRYPKTTWVIIIFFSMVLIGNILGPNQNNNASSAQLFCEITIGLQLKDESSAKYSNQNVINIGANLWEITGMVRAKNSFNAQVSSPFYCKLEYNSSKNSFNIIASKITN